MNFDDNEAMVLFLNKTTVNNMTMISKTKTKFTQKKKKKRKMTNNMILDKTEYNTPSSILLLLKYLKHSKQQQQLLPMHAIVQCTEQTNDWVDWRHDWPCARLFVLPRRLCDSSSWKRRSWT